MKFLMCKPTYYQVAYEINPWMQLSNPVAAHLAEAQWDRLYSIMCKLATEVALIEPVTNLPDLVFTANAGLFYQQQIVLSHFKYSERCLETPHFANWFRQHGFDISSEPKNYFEGAGDALLAGDKLFAGYGFRTDRAVYTTIAEFHDANIFFCELVNPYYYHLDTCFCPINDHQAIWYPAAFSPLSQQVMQAELELFAVPEVEAKRFACNSVIIDKQVVMPSGCPITTEWLEHQGFTVHSCDMNEFIKAGGACKCLTLRLD